VFQKSKVTALIDWDTSVGTAAQRRRGSIAREITTRWISLVPS
jgi:hypothetical protein